MCPRFAPRSANSIARATDGSARARPLPAELRRKFERAFGEDLSTVRIHDAPDVASGVRAFTRGEDIFVRLGRYSPTTRPGQELIGHEVGHVLQQRGGASMLPAPDGAPGLEREADDVGARAAQGGLGVSVHGGAAPGSVQCSPEEEFQKKQLAARQAELENLKGMQVVRGKPTWWGWGANPAVARNAQLEADLIKSGRAQSPQQIQTAENQLDDLAKLTRTNKNDAAVAAWKKGQQALQQREAQANKQLQVRAKQSTGTRRANLTPAEEQFIKSRQVDLKRSGGVPKLVQRQPGGPAEATREQYSQFILQGMERSVNREKLLPANTDAETQRLQGLLEQTQSTAVAQGAADFGQKLAPAIRAAHERQANVTTDPQNNGAKVSRGDVERRLQAIESPLHSLTDAQLEQQLHVAHSSPAHFYSRHGAQTTLSDQAARVAAGYAADQKPAVAPVGPPVQAMGNKAQIPAYATVGPGAVGESSRFSSHAKELGAISEAYAQVWNQQSGSLSQAQSFTEPFNEEHEVGQQVPRIRADNGQQVMVNGVPQFQTVYNWQSQMRNTNNAVQPTGRLEVTVAPEQIGGKTYGAEPGGYGEGVSLDKTANPPPALADPGQPLPALDLQQRAARLKHHKNIGGVQLFMDVNKQRGGYTVQTAYPTRDAPPSLSAVHSGIVPTGSRTDRNNVVVNQQARREYQRKLKRINEP